MCGYRRKEGSRGNLDATHQATATSPEAPAALPLSPPAGAGVAPAIPTPSCCWGQAGLQQRGTRLGVGAPNSDGLLDDVAYELSPQRVGSRAGPAAWRGCATLPPIVPEQPAPTVGCAPTPPDFPPSCLATPRAACEPAPTRGTGPSRPRGGAPFRAVPHRGGTWCPAPCYGGMTGALGKSSLGCCPYGVPIYGAAGQCQTSRGGGHSPARSSPPNGPHIRPAPEWRLDPATSHPALWGKAGTGPGRPPREERRRGGGGAM